MYVCILVGFVAAIISTMDSCTAVNTKTELILTILARSKMYKSSILPFPSLYPPNNTAWLESTMVKEKSWQRGGKSPVAVWAVHCVPEK